MNLAGLHDAESIAIAPPDTWAVDTVALSDNPASAIYPDDLTWIVRLNHGYGSTGTLPQPDQYEWFAQKVAAYVNGSQNCRRWIIGNEPNLPREWPDNQPILPWDYADCYKLCRTAIRTLPGHQRDEVLVAASGPWNAELSYVGNPDGDWVMYFADVLRLLHNQFDGVALHAYTHGYDVNLVTSMDRMDAPFQNHYYNFLTYRDYCDAIPPDALDCTCYITEANGDGPWQAVGLMPAMLGEIDFWNRSNNKPLIQCVAFYRWPHYDQFYIEGKGDVIAEYEGAVQLGYMAPIPSPIPEPPPLPTPTPPPSLPAADRYFDPALIARGVEVDTPALADGDKYWFADHLEWLDLQESGGRHHIYGNCYDEDGSELFGVKLKASWPTGASIVETKRDSFSPYAYNYPMSKSLNEFRIEVLASTYKSELVTGIGMGFAGNPAEHTSTVVKWKLRTHNAVIKPPDPKPEPPVKVTPLLWPVKGSVTQWFGQGGPQFGQVAHNGIDIACAINTHVLSVADGEVMMTGYEKDYGNYVRIWHPHLYFHSFYAHLSEINVLTGIRIKRGQVAAFSGNSGNSTGPHLHLEFRGGTRDGYVDVTYGYTQGRFDPRTIYLVTGAPLAPGGN